MREIARKWWRRLFSARETVATRFDVQVLRQLPSFVRGLGLGPDPDGVAAWADEFATRIERRIGQ